MTTTRGLSEVVGRVGYGLKRIKILSKAVGEVVAELSEERNPKTVKAIWSALPMKARANTWGDEIYFPIGVKAKSENAQQVVEKGDIGYWPPGDSFCIFFGRTPASVGDEIRAASPVNVFGRILGNPEVFKRVKQGDEITIDKAE